MLKFIYKYFKKEPLPIKDPKDWTLTKSSTPWQYQRYWCRSCKTNREHYQFMANICNNCGTFNQIDLHGCTIRQIWNGTKWVKQYKERNQIWIGE